MKKIFSLLVLCATVVFASCSKDDPVTDPVPEGIVVTTSSAIPAPTPMPFISNSPILIWTDKI